MEIFFKLFYLLVPLTPGKGIDPGHQPIIAFFDEFKIMMIFFGVETVVGNIRKDPERLVPETPGQGIPDPGSEFRQFYGCRCVH